MCASRKDQAETSSTSAPGSAHIPMRRTYTTPVSRQAAIIAQVPTASTSLPWPKIMFLTPSTSRPLSAPYCTIAPFAMPASTSSAV